jgi:hypothetical protein
MTAKRIHLKAYLFFLISWFVPGLGHFLLKKTTKAAVFFFGILFLIVLGLWMKGGFPSLIDLQPLNLLSFLGGLGNGVFFLVLRPLGFGVGVITSYTYYYGTAYIAAAGFLNYLIAINAYALVKGNSHV